MKSRWTILIGRTGSVLLVIGLALTIVAILPPSPSQYGGGGGIDLSPNKYKIRGSTHICTPYTGLRISITSNSSLQVYLLNIQFDQLSEEIMSWMIENDPNTNETFLGKGIDNSSVLEALLFTKIEIILLNETVSTHWNMDFFPTYIANVSMVFANPFNMTVEGDMNYHGLNALADKRRVIIPAGILLAFGLILILVYAVQQRP